MEKDIIKLPENENLKHKEDVMEILNLHVSKGDYLSVNLRLSAFKNPLMWAMVLADVARHISNGVDQHIEGEGDAFLRDLVKLFNRNVSSNQWLPGENFKTIDNSN